MRWIALALALALGGLAVYLLRTRESEERARAAPVTAPDTASTTASELAVAPEAAIPPPSLPEMTMRRISGLVVDAGGAPVAGAQVLHREKRSYGDWTPLAHKTRAEGRFVTGDLERKPWQLVATRRGFAEAMIVGEPGDNDLRLVLTLPGRISGRVVHRDGTPATKGSVSVGGTRIEAVPIGPRGRFEVDGVPAGWLLLWAMTDVRVSMGGIEEEVECEGALGLQLAAGEQREGVVLRLPEPRFSIVPLRLLDSSGGPLPGIEVGDTGTLWTLGEEPYRSDADGRLLIVTREYPGYGTKLTFARRGLGMERTRWIDTRSPDETEPVGFRFAPPLEVRFRVRDADGAALPEGTRAWLSLHPYDWHDTGNLGVDSFADECEVLLDPAWKDELFEYSVGAEGYATIDRERWAPPRDGGPVEIRLERAARLRARLLLPDGRPAGKAAVTWSGRYQTSDKEGWIDFWSLESGRHTLDISHAEAWLTERMRLSPGEFLDLGDLRLRPKREAKGIVVDEQGRALSNVLVSGSAGASTRTGLDGRFNLRVRGRADPERGEPVQLSRRGRAGAVVALDPDRETRVVLPPTGTVRLEPGESDYSDLEYRTLAGDDAPHDYEYSARFGEWVVTGLPPGTIRIHLIDYTGRTIATTDVEIAPEEVTVARLP